MGKEEQDFQGQEDEKIQNFRREILRKEEERKFSERKILLDKIKKVINLIFIKPLLENNIKNYNTSEKSDSFRLRKKYNNLKIMNQNYNKKNIFLKNNEFTHAK